MAMTEFIAAIELSSTKITGAAGIKDNDGSLKVLAYCEEPVMSIDKGIIININKTAEALRNTISCLEEKLESKIGKIYVCTGGRSMHSVHQKISRDLGEERMIDQLFIDDLMEENSRSVPDNMDILEMIPQEYTVRSLKQLDPVGMNAEKIDADYLNIIARKSLKSSIEQCFRIAGIDIVELFISPNILANSILTDAERRNGCALVDFGAQTTTVSIFKEGILRYLNVLPLGGQLITQDLTSLKIVADKAEELKKKFGDATYKKATDEEKEPKCEIDEDNSVTLYELNTIINARLQEILVNVSNMIEASGYKEKLLSGIVFTGGGSNLQNIDRLYLKFDAKAKIKLSQGTRFNVDCEGSIIRNDGTQGTIFGLLYKGSENCCKVERPFLNEKPQEAVLPFDNDELQRQEEEKKEAERIRKENEEKEKAQKRQKEEEKKQREEKQKRRMERFKKMIKGPFDMFAGGLLGEDEQLNDNDSDKK